MLLSEGLFCAFGCLNADGYHFQKPVIPLFRLWSSQEPIDLVPQQVVTVLHAFGIIRGVGIKKPVVVTVKSGEDNATATGELAEQSDYLPPPRLRKDIRNNPLG